MKIKIEVSARHIHLSKEDLEILFGENYELTKLKDLSQEGEFAAEEKIDIKNGDNIIFEVRIIGPVRDKTQLEISKTDCFVLKMNAPLKLSGDLDGSVGINLIGPKGYLEIKEGVIVAKRHLHCSPTEAEQLGVKDGEPVSIKVGGERSLIFNEIIVRVEEGFSLTIHIDTDEANSAGINMKGEGELLR